MNRTEPVKAGRRRGRPQRLPDDPVPISHRELDVEHRVAWLLATTRILHPDEALRQRETFIQQAAARGLKADASRISRWETGTAPAGPEVIAAYEAVYGRPAGALSSVIDGLRRAFGERPPRQPHNGEQPSRTPDRLLDKALHAGHMTGAEWHELAGLLTAYSSLYLRHPDWDALANRIVTELSRATGSGYVRRYEAAAQLIRHPSAQRHVSRALGSFVMHPETQVVLPVLQLLTEVDDDAAGRLVLRMMGEAHRGLRRAAAAVAAVKLRKGVLPEPSFRQLEAYAASSLRHGEPLDGGLDAFDVTMHLPSNSFRQVLEKVPDRRVQAQLGRSRSTGELLTRQQAAAIVADLAASVQADETDFPRHPEPDMLLRRLLREALFHMHKARRHQAALLLAASPYRRAVSRQLHELVGGSNYFLAARAWAVMMRVGHAGRRSDIVLRALSEPRPTLRSRALVNLGLDDQPLSAGEAQALVASVTPDERASVRHGLMFALGMSGSAVLDELVDHKDPSLSVPARWWREQGAAIHER